MSGRKPGYDIGLIVPLNEEFEYLTEVAPIRGHFVHEGRYFYDLDFGSRSVVCVVVNQMGPLPTLSTAQQLLASTEVRLLVLVGVAGGLSGDLALGDVVVGEEINEFQANAKAAGDGAAYTLQYSGRHWSLPWEIREAINNFRFAGRPYFDRWQQQAREHHSTCFANNDRIEETPGPRYLVGPIASGNTVAAAQAFVDEIKRVNRKFAAIDMESAGIALAAFERVHRLPCIVLRGISDKADEGKQIADLHGRGAWRRYSVCNAASLLRNLLDWNSFCGAAGLAGTAEEANADMPLIDLFNALQSHIGGGWLVGVLAGYLSHAPAIGSHRDDDESVIEIGKLRVSNQEFEELLREAEGVYSAYLATGALEATADRLSTALARYRLLLASDGAQQAQLTSFDRIVRSILETPNEDQVGSLLNEVERLEEERGPAAAADLLKDQIANSSILRARYVDLLAQSRAWSDIEATLGPIPISDLERTELEHLISARLTVGADISPMLALHAERYNDVVARVLRNEINRRRI
jgi:nucleoside phosphorylase